MFENENKNGFFPEGEQLDLGSDGAFAGFPDFGSAGIDEIFGSTEKSESTAEAIPTNTVVTVDVMGTVPESDSKTETESEDNAAKAEPKAEITQNAEKEADAENPFEAAIAKAEEKQAESIMETLVSKLPIFSYANAKEEIVDTSKTFDELRNEKAEDFPELDDGTSVTWKMTYGTVSKSVPTPKKTTIASLKKQIEDSKEFKDSLKKVKGEIECKVTPSVTAKKKGTKASYKGVCDSVEEAVASGKTIVFVPSDDGRVYEVRSNKIGVFITAAEKVSLMKKVRAGFIPALPKIPYSILSEILAFFKSYVTKDSEFEALAYIYWSFEDEKYYVHVPKQQVSKASVDSNLPELDEEKFVLVMEIHSHNTMAARFSPTDDRDERATRLYTVVGRMDKLFPDIATRISVGGKYVEIDPATVFEGFSGSFPQPWADAVDIRKPSYKEADL